jgi:hypothetical protein
LAASSLRLKPTLMWVLVVKSIGVFAFCAGAGREPSFAGTAFAPAIQEVAVAWPPEHVTAPTPSRALSRLNMNLGKG